MKESLLTPLVLYIKRLTMNCRVT